MPNRRHFLAASAGLAAASITRAAESAGAESPLIATQTYPWVTFYRREDRKLKMHSDELLAEIASTGIRGYEPIIGGPAEFDGLGERLEKHGLVMRSLYVGSDLHEAEDAEKSIARVLAIGEVAAENGVEIIVSNPSPLRGDRKDKTDAELRTQAHHLDRLGAGLRELGLTLAYHNHDVELRQGGREFHHMLTATDPENVRFCLDAHWVFRGCGDSEVALFDALEHYHDRVVELHIRQSENGAWTETFTPKGDIDYVRLFEYLKAKDIRPLFVLEQCVEGQSPDTLDAVAAHTGSRENLAGVI